MSGEFSIQNFYKAVEQMEQGCLQAAHEWGRDVEAQMRSDAPWMDRGGQDSVTGKTARESLEVEAGMMPDGTIQVVARSTRQSIHAWHGENAPVGAFLELGTRFMHPRAVIWPTVTARVDDLKRRLESVLRADM